MNTAVASDDGRPDGCTCVTAWHGVVPPPPCLVHSCSHCGHYHQRCPCWYVSTTTSSTSNNITWTVTR